MTVELSGKCVVITGGGSGISLAFAKLLVEKGCSILIGDLALTAEADALVTAHPYDTSHAKPFVLFHKTDVTSWPQLSSLWQTALQRFTAVDIVVPGAGVFEPPFSNFWKPPKTETNPDTPSGDQAGAEPGHFATLDINLVAPIRLSQVAIGHWTTTKREGCLVLLGSVAGFITAPNRPLYHVSKHGLHAFVRSLGVMRDELGIRIGAVAPGPVKTPLWDHVKTNVDVPWADVDDVVRAMYELVVNKDMGNGTILEVLATGTREVPPAHGIEGLSSLTVSGHQKPQAILMEDLRTNGLSV